MLIALTLVTLCLFPLLKPQAAIRIKRMEAIDHLQLPRLSHLYLATIKRQLYENRFSWKQLRNGYQSPESELQGYRCSYTLEEVEHCRRKNSGKCHLLLEATLTFQKGKKTHTFSYPLLVHQLPVGERYAL